MENVLDVLLYLFENYLEGELEDGSQRSELSDELLAAGFPSAQVEHAFAWMEGLRRQRELPLPAPTESTIRLYNSEERELIPVDGLGFLQHLQQIGILSATDREHVIERLLALAYRGEAEQVALDDIKWVVLMVLFNQPQRVAAGSELEDMLYSYEAGMLH